MIADQFDRMLAIILRACQLRTHNKILTEKMLHWQTGYWRGRGTISVVTDGVTSNETFRQMKKKQVPVIFSTDTEEDFRYMIEHIENEFWMTTVK
ncbi:hypothetical protein DP091_19495 [Paenibacillus sp. MDMC362]|nr:hypothetical protein DP091_19495 [Paenibacillus sp. MDMC362]